MQLRIAAKKAIISPKVRQSVERQLRFALTRFAPSVSGVRVTLTDESGPKGPPTRKCRLLIQLRPKGQMVIESIADSFDSAASRAAERAGRSVARHLERRRSNRKYQRRRLPIEMEVSAVASQPPTLT